MKFLVVDANVIFSCLLKGKAFENIFQAKIGIRDFLKRQRKYLQIIKIFRILLFPLLLIKLLFGPGR